MAVTNDRPPSSTHAGRLGSATKRGVWQKLDFDDDEEIDAMSVAADGNFIVFAGASGKVYFAGDRPGVEKGEASWAAEPEVLDVPVGGGTARAAKKKDENDQPPQPPPGGGFGGGGGLFGGIGYGGGGFGGGGGGGGGFGAPAFGNPFGNPGGGFGMPQPFGAADEGKGKEKEKNKTDLEFKKADLGSGEPESGWRLATTADVRENLDVALASLTQWDMVRACVDSPYANLCEFTLCCARWSWRMEKSWGLATATLHSQ
jgi:hypothetical protein